MRIGAARAWPEDIALARPYTIARGSTEAVEMAFVALRTDGGLTGHGMASPATEVTGETRAEALAELQQACAQALPGCDAADPELPALVQSRCRGPAARAALDMALLDLRAQAAGVALADWFGRVHEPLPTSVTIGCKPVAETLAEAEEYRARGFHVLKVKVGLDPDLDLERLARLREAHGASLVLRADANQGYDERAMLDLAAAARRLGLEMIEQPMAPGNEPFLRTLPQDVQRMLCADESVHDAHDLERLADGGIPYGIVNIKLQKCGGPTPAVQLARACERHGLAVMWGCNDESVVGIAAALHTAFACRATRFLDLDGSLDLARDPFAGGFALHEGILSTLPRPGLGVVPTAP